MSQTLPLFPLSTVLFPGSLLPLRIFERRYLDMIRDCARTGSSFGVVCLLPATDQQPAGHSRIGTEAVIEDFSTLEDGLLGVSCRGHRRFRVEATRTRDDGLLVGEVHWLVPAPAVAVPARFGALQAMMRELVGMPEVASNIEVDLDQADSLGFALASLLPLHFTRAQGLLEITDPIERLEQLVLLLQQAEADD